MLRADGTKETLFQEEWWLDASSAGRYEEVSVSWDGRRVASLPFLKRKKFGYTSISMPPYTRTLGPVLQLPAAKPARTQINLARVAAELVRGLPAHDRFYQLLDPKSAVALAFGLAGCELTQEFTFRIRPDSCLGDVFDAIDGSTRSQIRGVANRLRLDLHADVDRFIRVSLCDRPPGRNRHDFPAIRRIFDAAHRRQQGVVMAAVDEANVDRASVVLVWGAGVAYYLLSARDRGSAFAGANAFLLNEAIRYAHGRGLIFDFDGFGSRATGRFLLNFGCKPIVRTGILRSSILGKARDVAFHLLPRAQRPF